MATDLERLVVSLEARTNQFQKEMERARGVTDRQMKAVEARTSRAATAVTNNFKRIGAGLAASLATGLSVAEVGKFAESFTKVQNSLKVAGLEGERLRSTYEQLFAVAQRQGAPIEAVADLYGKLTTSQKELNATGPEMLTFTEAVATSLKVQGSSAAEASGALLQLAQAMGGGKIQAEEYNSLLDGARPLLQATAAGLKEAGGSVSKLTALVKDGKVSSEAFFRATLAGYPQLQQQAGRTSLTMAQGTQKVSNAFTDLVGKLDDATGASRNAASNLENVGKAIGTIGTYVPGAVSQLEALRTKMNQVGNLPVWDRIREGFGKFGLTGNVGGTGEGVVDVVPLNRGGPTATMDPMSDGTIPAPIKQVSLGDFKPPPGGGGGGGGGGARGRTDPVQSFTQSLDRERTAIEAEAAALGKSNLEKQIALNLAEAGKGATEAQREAIVASTTAIEAARAKVEEYETSQRRAEQAAQEFGSTLSNAFQDAVLNGEKLTDVARNLARTFASKAIDSAFSSLFSAAGLGSLFASGLGGPAGTGSIKVGPRAAGGPVSAGSPYLVGERGRELFVPSTPGKIIPNNKLGGGGNSPTIVNVNVSGATGNMEVMQMVQKGVQAGMQAQTRYVERNIGAIVRNYDKRWG